MTSLLPGDDAGVGHYDSHDERRMPRCAINGHQCSRIRIFRFFSDFKKNMTSRFFEMTDQKVVKSHQQKFSPQYVTKE